MGNSVAPSDWTHKVAHMCICIIELASQAVVLRWWRPAGALAALQESLAPARSEVFLGKLRGRLLFLPGAAV